MKVKSALIKQQDPADTQHVVSYAIAAVVAVASAGLTVWRAVEMYRRYRREQASA